MYQNKLWLQIMRIIFVFLVVGFSFKLNAEDEHGIKEKKEKDKKEKKVNFFKQIYRGWLWFEEDEIIDDEETLQTSIPTREEMLDAKYQNKKFKKELSLLRHLIIHNPDNLEYIKLYKLKEKEMMDRAVVLSKNWILVNLLNPEIVDELKNPQNMYGRKIKEDVKEQKDQEKLKDLASKIEIFVFRKANCPYCADLEKALARFRDKYGFKVEAVVYDNSNSSYFKTTNSPELIKELNLQVMPTVIAVTNDSLQRFEIARGAVSVSNLEDKALLIVRYLKKQQINEINNQKREDQ